MSYGPQMDQKIHFFNIQDLVLKRIAYAWNAQTEGSTRKKWFLDVSCKMLAVQVVAPEARFWGSVRRWALLLPEAAAVPHDPTRSPILKTGMWGRSREITVLKGKWEFLKGFRTKIAQINQIAAGPAKSENCRTCYTIFFFLNIHSLKYSMMQHYKIK